MANYTLDELMGRECCFNCANYAVGDLNRTGGTCSKGNRGQHLEPTYKCNGSMWGSTYKRAIKSKKQSLADLDQINKHCR